jgi:hypothetical protein
MADNFDMKKFLVENKLGAYSKLKEVEEAKTSVSKEQKIQVIKEWIWFTCDEGQIKDDIIKYNKMIDMYFADKNDVTKEDFKKIWAKVTEKHGVGDVGADWDAFPETWSDVQKGNLVNPSKTYEDKEEKLAEDMGKDIEDAEAAKMMDFLAEYEVIYVVRDGKCYRKDDEGNMDEVNMSYCRRYAEGKEEKEEGYMGTQYDSSEDMAVDMVKKGLPEEKVEEAGQGSLMIISRIEEIVNNLTSNISTNSNIPTQEKVGLMQALEELKEYVEDLGADIEQEDEYVSDYSRRRASELSEESVRMFKSDNPEGDKLVLQFLKGIAKKFDYPVSQAALFVKERIKKLGY